MPSVHLADLGVYGFERHETAIFASLVTEDPLLLVGRSGTGKTFLLNTLSEALGGGAIFGKDPMHVDRFGARQARDMAIDAVKQGAGECLVRRCVCA